MTHAKSNSVRRLRRGFTLVELLVTVVLFGIIGAALTKLLTTQGRFYDKMGMMHAARNVSRGSLNRVVTDFRMIEATGGVISASSSAITVRIPFAIGVVCTGNGGWTHISMLPVDSVMYNSPGFYGYAWRSPTTSAYTYQDNASSNSGSIAVCDGVNITTVPPAGQPAANGLVVRLQPALPAAATLGTPVFLYRKIRYEFKNSTAVPGKLGLFRTVILQGGGESSEEIVAPFAATSGFKFFVVGNSTTAQAAPPAALSDMRGIELHLDGVSENKVAGNVSNEAAPFTTAVFFRNRIF
jgi:prepilin-type N-terminal cleavage/methylation domain-containing protein